MLNRLRVSVDEAFANQVAISFINQAGSLLHQQGVHQMEKYQDMAVQGHHKNLLELSQHFIDANFAPGQPQRNLITRYQLLAMTAPAIVLKAQLAQLSESDERQM